MGSITSCETTLCTKCGMAAAHGRWGLCRACEDEIAAGIYRKLGPIPLRLACAGCSERKFLVDGVFCSTCKEQFTFKPEFDID
jgi:hypothetical protein